jgi:hypothetical protein
VGCHFCAVQSYFGARCWLRPPKSIRGELLDLFGHRPPQAKWKNWLARRASAIRRDSVKVRRKQTLEPRVCETCVSTEHGTG